MVAFLFSVMGGSAFLLVAGLLPRRSWWPRVALGVCMAGFPEFSLVVSLFVSVTFLSAFSLAARLMLAVSFSAFSLVTVLLFVSVSPFAVELQFSLVIFGFFFFWVMCSVGFVRSKAAEPPNAFTAW